MEIDFLGLNSKHSHSISEMKQEHITMDSFTNASGDEISLSLSTSCSPMDSQREILGFRETQKNIWELRPGTMNNSCGRSNYNCESRGLDNHNLYNAPINGQPCLVLAPTPLFYPSSTTRFPYDESTNSRNISVLPGQPASVTSLYSSLPEKTHKTMFMDGDASSRPSANVRNCSGAGYTPTVAMARRATLARFLEKRSHRLTQRRTSELTGKSSTTSDNSEVGNMNAINCNKTRKKKT